MSTLDKSQKQATSRFSDGCNAVMQCASQLLTAQDELITFIVLVVKAFPNVALRAVDLRLSHYQLTGLNTWSPGVKDYFNIHTGQQTQCGGKGDGKPKTSTAVALQECLARIGAECPDGKLSHLIGWTDSGGGEVAPALQDLRQHSKSTAKHDKQEKSATPPTKVVGQAANAPETTKYDTAALEMQLNRLRLTVGKSSTQEMVNQYTGDISKLVDQIIERQAKIAA